LGSREQDTGFSDWLSGLKWSRSYSEALETLVSLVAYGVGKSWPKTDTENCSAT